MYVKGVLNADTQLCEVATNESTCENHKYFLNLFVANIIEFDG